VILNHNKMIVENEYFSLELDGVKMNIQEHTVHYMQVFRINFSDNRAPLNITRISSKMGKTWVSVPQGRQKEAEQIGSLIVEYFKTK